MTVENFKQKVVVVGKVVHDFNPGNQEGEAEASGYCPLMPAWSTCQVTEQPKLQRETLFPKANNNSNNDDALLT